MPGGRTRTVQGAGEKCYGSPATPAKSSAAKVTGTIKRRFNSTFVGWCGKSEKTLCKEGLSDLVGSLLWKKHDPLGGKRGLRKDQT